MTPHLLALAYTAGAAITGALLLRDGLRVHHRDEALFVIALAALVAIWPVGLVFIVWEDS